MKLLTLFALLILAFPLNAAEREEAGDVFRSRGVAEATGLTGIRPLHRSDKVYSGESLRTGGASRLEIVLVDGGKLSLGDNGFLTIDETVYDPGKKGSMVLSLARGVFRMISGKANKVAGGKLVISTPVATIGVRGTDFWGAQERGKLTMALLNDGELIIKTRSGTRHLTRPLQAIVIEKGKPLGDIFTLTEDQLEAAKKTVRW